MNQKYDLASDSRTERLGHAKCERNGNRSVNRIATGRQDFRACASSFRCSRGYDTGEVATLCGCAAHEEPATQNKEGDPSSVRRSQRYYPPWALHHSRSAFIRQARFSEFVMNGARDNSN
jgi:hypothetical protein